MIEIEIAQPKDWEFFRDLRLQALTESPEAFSSTFERENSFTKDEWISRMTNGSSFIATEEGVGVGIVGVMQFEETKSQEYKIVSMWVSPDFRGTDLASALVSDAKKWAIRNGGSSIYLHVESNNLAAINFYKKVGFEQIPNTRFNPENSEHQYIEMTCEL